MMMMPFNVKDLRIMGPLLRPFPLFFLAGTMIPILTGFNTTFRPNLTRLFAPKDDDDAF
jgi:hypothetical protein